MLLYRARFLHGSDKRVLSPSRAPLFKPQCLPKLHYHPGWSHGYRSASQGKQKAVLSKTFRYKVLARTLILITPLFVTYQHGVLHNYGFFHNIANSLIVRLVPPKLIEPPESESGTIYKPLNLDNEIRLLVLEPGAPSDKLECKLVHAQLSWRNKYEALSYRWGDEAIQRQIECHGRTVNITANLHDALSDLRYVDRQRVLWVDQICINQKDNQEKSKQVALMGSVYSQARQVLIYLGKADQSTEGSIEAIRRLDQRFQPLYIRSYLTRSQYLLHDNKWFLENWGLEPIPREETNWSQIFNLLHRSWFQRTWVFQEAVLPKNGQVICGDQSIPWHIFERVIASLPIYSGLVDQVPGISSLDSFFSNFYLMTAARWLRHTVKAKYRVLVERLISRSSHEQESPKLLDLIAQSRSFACTNPSDKVYGMLGVTGQDTKSHYLEPQFSMPPEDVYRNFVLWEVFENRSLRVLGLTSDKGSRQYASPSWVPNFNKLDPQVSLTGTDMRVIQYNASAGLPVEAWKADGDATLHLKGKIIDMIHTVGKESFEKPKAWTDATTHIAETWKLNIHMLQEAKDIWLAARQRSANSQEATPKVEDLFATRLQHGRLVQIEHISSNWEPFLRTLVCNQVDGRIKFSKQSLSAVASVVRPVMIIGHDRWWRFITYINFEPLGMGMIETAAFSRRFAGTNGGLIGYVPMKAKEGDLVVIFHGAKVPHVVRKAARDKYVLVGECYMDGIMHGEAMKGSKIVVKNVEFGLI